MRRTPDWHEAVRDLTRGLGADRIVEVGGPAIIAQSVRSIREGGQVSIVGALGFEGKAIDVMKLFFSQATYKVISVGNRSDLEEMNRAVAAHQISPVIDNVFAFEERPLGLRAPRQPKCLRQGRHSQLIVARTLKEILV
ncbi:zinc-binding dehydrogenase [Agrobacterium tumefaciens]|uniref:zinc-binding dehydrogenase n=1 Tax=Agrobacterium tumefaciens TaxID=358 RepID=UPI001F2B6A5E|nr:zinc-binding dehydrogenase [Agrobacterium tumefaciens]WCK22139.1 zinc-binding dehydrogenase [Agrobacterium tumefaciens]WCK68971.1 zinc-binding dehydrogenase [Agrobacterium tumefaciens]